VSSSTVAPQLHEASLGASIQQPIITMVDDLMASLRDPKQMTSSERRGIIARYTAVLEGNFIYWMTATNLAVHADEARPILLENLYEEVRDSHPAMLRRFAVAAHAFPTDTDALAIDTDLENVRLFLGKLQGVQSLLTMAFFETFIQRFMSYLADLAVAQGSSEMVYTDVHGVCDVAHSEGLFTAVGLEMAVNPIGADTDLFEGVDLLRTLIVAIIQGPTQKLN
jgi:hypothetical protein